jgi:hypothetical protein
MYLRRAMQDRNRTLCGTDRINGVCLVVALDARGELRVIPLLALRVYVIGEMLAAISGTIVA